jgi:MFS family permease
MDKGKLLFKCVSSKTKVRYRDWRTAGIAAVVVSVVASVVGYILLSFIDSQFYVHWVFPFTIGAALFIFLMGVVTAFVGFLHKPAIFYENGLEFYLEGKSVYRFFPYTKFKELAKNVDLIDGEHYDLVPKNKKVPEVFLPIGVDEVETHIEGIRKKIHKE